MGALPGIDGFARGVAFVAPRLLSALPDLLTAGACLLVWVVPLALGMDAVKSVLLTMLMEFILVHATGFFTAAVVPGGRSRGTRIAAVFGLSAFYLLFVLAFSVAFHAWWPLGVFGWLVVGKLAWVFANPRGREAEMGRQMAAWAFSVAAYLGAVFAGLLLPLPRLGLDAATVAGLHLPGGGEWIAHPHTAVAAAVFYYTALALFKARGGSKPESRGNA